jgi:hypothetical protein
MSRIEMRQGSHAPQKPLPPMQESCIEGTWFWNVGAVKLAGFLKQAQRQVATLDHIARDFEVANALVVGQMIHEVKH